MCAMPSSSKGKRKRKAGDEEPDICPACLYFIKKEQFIADNGLQGWCKFKKSMLPQEVQNLSKRTHRHDHTCTAGDDGRKSGPPPKDREVEGCPACLGLHKKHTCGRAKSIDLDDRTHPLNKDPPKKRAKAEAKAEAEVPKPKGGRAPAPVEPPVAKRTRRSEPVPPAMPHPTAPMGCPSRGDTAACGVGRRRPTAMPTRGMRVPPAARRP